MNKSGRMLVGAVAMLAMTGVSQAAPAKAPPELPPQAKVGGVQLQAEPVTVQTMLSFEKPGQQTFVLERYDPKTGAFIDRVIEPLKAPAELVSVKDFTRRINGRLFKSYGLDVCPVKKVFFFGDVRDCADAIKLDTRMLGPRISVLLCRVLASEREPFTSECFYVVKERSDTANPEVGAESNDDSLVMFGLATLVKTDSAVLRPDLERTHFFSVQQETGMHRLNRGKRK